MIDDDRGMVIVVPKDAPVMVVSKDAPAPMDAPDAAVRGGC